MSTLRASRARISQLKIKLQSIIRNIKELEQQQAATTSNVAAVDKLTMETRQMLCELEQAPLSKLAKVIKKRQQRRQLNKKKRRNVKRILPSVRMPNEAALTRTTAAAVVATETVQRETTTSSGQVRHHQLRSCLEAQRLLRTFELLKLLHLARGGDADATRRFASKFSSMCAIWNSLLLEHTPRRTEQRKIEDQWDEVFFGPSERTYYGGGEQKMGDFLRIRRYWDSYLTRSSKRGSCIPSGWVLPSADATAAWQQYRAA